MMDLVDLVVTVCMIAHPQSCQDRHILVESRGSLRTCMYEAQFYLAKWIGEHPNVVIKRWQCEWPNQEGKQT